MHALKRIGLLLLAIAFIIMFLYGALRFASEFGVSPLRYLVEDAGCAILGLFGLIRCYQKSAELKKAVAAETKQVVAASMAAEVFTANRFEANARQWLRLIPPLLVLLALFLTFVVAQVRPLLPIPLLLVVLFLASTIFILATVESQFRRGKPTLVMDSFGLDHAWFGPIRWDQIQAIRLQQFQANHVTQRTLHLAVIKPGLYLERAAWSQRIFLTRKRREEAVGEIVIPLKSLDRPAELIYQAALELRNRVSPPLLTLWYPGMSEQQIALQREAETRFQRLEEITTALEAGRITPEEANAQLQRAMETHDRQT